MDFQTLKRRDLQSLCKLNNIPANTTNAAMADALASLPSVEGLEEFLASEAQKSPERSATASSNVPGSAATRTRCRTRTRAVEGTDTKKTPVTRTTRKRATQEASLKKMEKDLQAEFEAGLEKSEVTEDNVLPVGELKEISEEVSGLSVENGRQLSENQSEAQIEVQSEVHDGPEVIDLDDSLVSKAQDEASETLSDCEKVNFHSLGRKDLQNLCKKNKIPANMTNAAMADALDSLETVEGLQEFLKDCESRAPSSPLVSGITSSCARQSRTTMKVTKEEPRSSRLITKSCRVSRRRIAEKTELVKSDVSETSAAPSTQQKSVEAASALSEKESIQKQEDSAVHKREDSEVLGVAEFIGDISNSLTQEAQVNESTLEDDKEKGNEGLYNVERLESVEDTEVLIDLVKNVDLGPELVATFSHQDGDLKFCSADGKLEVQKSSDLETDAENETQEGQFDNSITALDSAADSCVLEKPDNIHTEDHMSKQEFVSESAAQADQLLSLEIIEEEGASFTFDSAAHISHAKYEMSEKSTTQADKLSMEITVDSEGSCTEIETSDSESEDGMSDNSDSEPTTQDELSLDISTDSAADLFKNQFDTESTIQVRFCVPMESKTPLNHKSLRKLKRMYKEKLQEKTLAMQMGMLSLDETEIPLNKVVEENLQKGNDDAPVSRVMPDYSKVKVDNVEESEEDTNDKTQFENDSVEQEDALQETLVTTSDVETTKLSPVDILLDNEVISEEAVRGDITVVIPSKSPTMTKKPLLCTPTKSSYKTPGRGNRDLDVNKENIDSSVSKTEPGKIKVAVTGSGKIMSAMSMGMLKKEFKVLQSDKKRQALQSRSENQCLLASP